MLEPLGVGRKIRVGGARDGIVGWRLRRVQWPQTLVLCCAKCLPRFKTHLHHDRQSLVARDEASILFVLRSLKKTFAETLSARFHFTLPPAFGPILLILQRGLLGSLLSNLGVCFGRRCGVGIDEKLVDVREIVVFIVRHSEFAFTFQFRPETVTRIDVTQKWINVIFEILVKRVN